MPRTSVRRAVSAALCAALTLGFVATASGAPLSGTAVPPAPGPADTPVPRTKALLAQAGGLGTLGGVLTPVARLVDAALRADGGRLPADQAGRLADAATDALGKLATAKPPSRPASTPGPATATAATLPAPARPTVTSSPSASAARPSTPSTPSTPASWAAGAGTPPAASSPAPVRPSGGTSAGTAVRRASAPAAADLRGEAVAALRKRVDALVRAATAGDAARVASTADGVVRGLVDLVAVVMLTGGLPAPDLTGLPSLPDTPSASAR
ncbi:hypothetical protein MTQ10_19710 [Streptomyces sp. XM83C]|uniref:hypothetical protein n=1 Tax=unclassified Streptomyces TaxID=2593676 RepID=UPI001FF96A68|nr:hypothetical protein [Streptomyces sp. XM83C]MCK1821781.1 hypothetical protein [Streptomyces sp. XM83C]